jgi:polyisoprenoid-binding protein YceI
MRMVLLAAALVAAPSLAPAQAARPAAAAAAPQWVVDQKASRIAFSTQWAGSAVNGAFNQWTADIRFDPRNLAGSRAVVVIQTGSARTGQGDPDQNLPGDDWFNVKAFPTARFEATRFTALGGNRYQADGMLTVKGRATPVRLPFTLDVAGNVATMRGQVSLDRIALGLGLQSDPTSEWVSRQTAVTVSVQATRRP